MVRLAEHFFLKINFESTLPNSFQNLFIITLEALLLIHKKKYPYFTKHIELHFHESVKNGFETHN